MYGVSDSVTTKSGLHANVYERQSVGDTYISIVYQRRLLEREKGKETLRTPRKQFADMWSFPFVGISLASSGSRIDIDKTCFEGKYPKNLCIGCFSVPFCIVGTGGLCSKLDISKKGRSEPNSQKRQAYLLHSTEGWGHSQRFKWDMYPFYGAGQILVVP